MAWPTIVMFALALATCLAACGGGGSSATTPTAATSTEAATPGFIKRAESKSTLAAERRAAGRAASFVEPRSDNSIPTFGSELGAAERGQAEANLGAYLKARAAGEWALACRNLAAETRRGYQRLAVKSGKGHSCAAILPTLAPIQSGIPADPLVGGLLALRGQGSDGFALFYGPPNQQRYMVPMRREGGQWRPTQASPIAYPPGTATTGSP